MFVVRCNKCSGVCGSWKNLMWNVGQLRTFFLCPSFHSKSNQSLFPIIFTFIYIHSNTPMATCASQLKFDQHHLLTPGADGAASEITTEEGLSTFNSIHSFDNLILTIGLQVLQVIVVLHVRQHRWPCQKRVSSENSIQYLAINWWLIAWVGTAPTGKKPAATLKRKQSADEVLMLKAKKAKGRPVARTYLVHLSVSKYWSMCSPIASQDCCTNQVNVKVQRFVDQLDWTCMPNLDMHSSLPTS